LANYIPKLLNVYLFSHLTSIHSNHQFQISYLPVADPAVSSASGIPFLPIGCYLSQS